MATVIVKVNPITLISISTTSTTRSSTTPTSTRTTVPTTVLSLIAVVSLTTPTTTTTTTISYFSFPDFPFTTITFFPTPRDIEPNANISTDAKLTRSISPTVTFVEPSSAFGNLFNFQYSLFYNYCAFILCFINNKRILLF